MMLRLQQRIFVAYFLRLLYLIPPPLEPYT